MAVGSFINQANALDKDERSGSKIYPGTYVGIVKDNKDVGQRAGRLWVYIPEFQSDEDNPNSWIAVSYASPFYGISPHAPPRDDKDNELAPVTTYGFWAIPPDIGVRVLCTFITGKQTLGYWFAVIPGLSHSMVPANGAPDGKTPVMDLNPYDPKNNNDKDLSAIKRQPYEALTAQFGAQGLAEDPIRGPITSSSLRESPSRVFGISSQSTPEAPGHSFVMDDGGEDGKNKLIRLRTSGGNQITMHDDTGMIYLTNAGGTGWIELSPSGQIDVFGAAGINLATNGELNLHADKNVNIHAGECVKIVGMKGTKVMGGEELQLHGKKTMIEGVDSLHVHSCTEMMFTSFGDIHMKAFNYFCLKGKCFYWNSCTAKEAEQVPPEEPADVSGYQTTVARAPSKEPYKEHDGGQGAGGAGGAGGDMGAADGTSRGDNFSLGFATGLEGNKFDTAATSLGKDYNLGFRSGLPGNKIGTGSNNWGTGAGQTQPRDSSTSTARTSVTNSSTYTAPTAARTTNIQGAVRTSSGTTVSSTYKPATSVNNTNATANAALSGSFTTNYGVNKPSTLTVNSTSPNNTSVTADAALSGSFTSNYANTPATTSTNIPVSDPAANPYLGRGGAQPIGADPALANVPTPGQQPNGMFDSSNPADQAATGRSPAQDASSALDQMGGMSPSSDLPAASGGGGSGCFATGDNCERPADETGGAGGEEGTVDQSGQSAGDIPSDASDEDIAARTIAGECRGCSSEEQAAIGEVLRNRAKANGTSVKTEALRYKQFSTWNAGDPNRSYITNLNPSSSTYQSALNAYKTSANTNYSFGATHYYNARTARPAWGSSLTSTRVYGSGHRFGYIRGEYGK